MKKTAILVLAIAAGFTAIAKRHKNKKLPQSGNEIISVKMQRTPCYGRCPDYTIDINKNGTVTYNGIRFTADSGVFTKNIGSKAEEILNQFDSLRVDTCKNKYQSRSTDLPGIIYQIHYKDSAKIILNANWGPGYLRLMANKMDALGNKTDNTGWLKAITPTKK